MAETKKYEILAFAARTKIKELHLDGFGIQQIKFREFEEDPNIYIAEAELTEEQAQYLREHGFMLEESEETP